MSAPIPNAIREPAKPPAAAKRAAAKPPTSDAAAASFAALTIKLDYLDAADIKRVREAYRFADEAHLGQFRASSSRLPLSLGAASMRARSRASASPVRPVDIRIA
jgi:hypothetical protein